MVGAFQICQLVMGGEGRGDEGETGEREGGRGGEGSV